MAESLLATAIANWEPRFTANGVDASDYQRITSSLNTWDEWCAAWSRGADVHLSLAEEALNEDRHRSAGEFFARAATYFHFASFLFVHDPQQARAAHQCAVESLTRSLPLLDPPGRREVVRFEQVSLVGVLRVPRGDGPHPTVILIPGLDSTKEELREVERAFLDRAMATFSLDGPGQGEVESQAPITSRWDLVGAAVVEHLSTLPEVDQARLGVWGVSLGGFYAARLAASDLPIVAAVALSGPYDFAAHWGNLNPLTRLAFRVRSGATSDEDAEHRARALTLEGVARRITCALLVITGGRDRLFSPEDGRRLVADAAGPVRSHFIDEGNHGCANVVYRHRPFSADWMAQHLNAPGSVPEIGQE